MTETSGTIRERYYLIDLVDQTCTAYDSPEGVEEVLGLLGGDPDDINDNINDSKIIVVKGKEVGIEQEITALKLTLAT